MLDLEKVYVATCDNRLCGKVKFMQRGYIMAAKNDLEDTYNWIIYRPFIKKDDIDMFTFCSQECYDKYMGEE